MYTRTYEADEKTITVPENYDGNAFREEPAAEDFKECAPVINEVVHETRRVAKNDEPGILAGLFKKLPLQGMFGSLGIKSISDFKIGSEEILIVGLALFLFFSKGGDNELAFMLLLLLFVK